ncbi:MAG: DUF456 family protein [Desulfobacterales bacterium]|nr:DUF456 family protein [Desulfobacterales bacterium]
MSIFVWVLVVLLVLLGIMGTFLPGLVGAPLVFLGLLLAAWAGDFEKVGVFTLSVLAILTLLAIGIDFLATSLGAKRVGASNVAILGAAIGTVVGLFFGIAGLVFGPFLGAVAGEYAKQRELLQAGKVGLGTWLGLVCGLAGRVALVFAMVGIFVTSYIL